MNKRYDEITVYDLVYEVSKIHSCHLMMERSELFDNFENCSALNNIKYILGNTAKNFYDARQMFALKVAKEGSLDLGVPGVEPRVMRMIECGDVSLYHSRTGLPFIKLSEVLKFPEAWKMSGEDADKIRKKILTEKQREVILLKYSEGRYTLDDAAELIFESEFCNVDKAPEELLGERGESVDIEFSEILNELSNAARSGALLMYLPGTDNRFSYSQRINTEVRVFYEEAYWRDLNRWLDKNKKDVFFRFPDPAENSFLKKYRGVTKGEILSVDWGLPAGHKLENILDEVPKWVVDARVLPGKPGGGVKGSSLWNPVLLADALLETTSHKKWKASIGTIDTLFGGRFKDFLEEWNDHKADFIQGVDTGE